MPEAMVLRELGAVTMKLSPCWRPSAIQTMLSATWEGQAQCYVVYTTGKNKITSALSQPLRLETPLSPFFHSKSRRPERLRRLKFIPQSTRLSRLILMCLLRSFHLFRATLVPHTRYIVGSRVSSRNLMTLSEVVSPKGY